MGAEFVRLLVGKGYRVICVARSRDKLEKLCGELPKGQTEIIVEDLSRPKASKQVFERTLELGLSIDLLVNNAGVGFYSAFSKSPLDHQMQMIDLNIRSLTELTHLYLPKMIERKAGGIINVASTAAFQAGPMMAVYYASKAYVLHFSEALQVEYAGSGVHIMALCPGPTQSEFMIAAKMENNSLFSSRKLPSSKEVAEFALKQFERNQPIAIHGFLNRILAFSVRFAPRKLVSKVVLMIQSEN